jgi:uncharacterized membrane protein
MKLESKSFKIYTTRSELLKYMRNKLRSVKEFSFYIPFINSKCDWVAGSIHDAYFELSDYRFPPKLISFIGVIEEYEDYVEVNFFSHIWNKVVIIQSLFLILFLTMFFLVSSMEARLSILIAFFVAEVGNYLLYLIISLSFYNFFVKLFRANNIKIILV